MKHVLAIVLAIIALASGSSQAVTYTSPTAVISGPYSINQGDILLLNGSASVDPNPSAIITKYSWDLNNDGVYDIFGMTPTVSYSVFDSLMTARLGSSWLKGTSINPISLNVVDSLGLSSNAYSVVTVTPLPPVPEPQTYVMMLTGLVFLSFVSLRRC